MKPLKIIEGTKTKKPKYVVKVKDKMPDEPAVFFIPKNISHYPFHSSFRIE